MHLLNSHYNIIIHTYNTNNPVLELVRQKTFYPTQNPNYSNTSNNCTTLDDALNNHQTLTRTVF